MGVYTCNSFKELHKNINATDSQNGQNCYISIVHTVMCGVTRDENR